MNFLKLIIQTLIIVFFLFLNTNADDPFPEFLVLFFSYILSKVIVEIIFVIPEILNKNNNNQK